MTTQTTFDRSNTRLTDAGLETVLIFEEGFDLPEFAAFPLVRDAAGREALSRYYRGFVELADREDVEVVLDTPTWRASTTWGAALGFGSADLEAVNVEAVELLHEVRDSVEADAPVLISGCVGSRTDGYRGDDRIAIEAARAYHHAQIRTLKGAGVDLVTALTMTYADEAAGIALAARDIGVPVVISFTVETDGRLPSGESLRAAIELVDGATGNYPIHFGINCAHPDHFVDVLDPAEEWTRRIGLVRSNASRLSHAELDEAEELDAGDPHEWGGDVAALHAVLPGLCTIGGCCGTNHSHIAAASTASLARVGL
jgi:S-methylmethionine-dependent homocysteine/selenocysteine methylase